METRRCAACSRAQGKDVLHPLSAFGREKRNPDGISWSCLAVLTARARKSQERKDNERRLKAMTIPYRPDRVFKGQPGKVVKVVQLKYKGWIE